MWGCWVRLLKNAASFKCCVSDSLLQTAVISGFVLSLSLGNSTTATLACCCLLPERVNLNLATLHPQGAGTRPQEGLQGLAHTGRASWHHPRPFVCKGPTASHRSGVNPFASDLSCLQNSVTETEARPPATIYATMHAMRPCTHSIPKP